MMTAKATRFLGSAVTWGVVSIGGAQAGIATAQTAAETPSIATPRAADSAPTTLGDIIVTAQKRAQRLQDVPVSITALPGRQIEELRISDLRSIQSYVPNLAVLNSGVNPVVYIRGFGSGPNNVAFDQEVSVYSDGIYGGRGAQFSAPFFDLERMEVLRGPQGALFGRNTAAGAISLVSAKPTRTFEGFATAGYDAQRGGFEGSAVVSGPLTDTLAARLAGQIDHTNGYIRNLFNGKDDPRKRDELLRATLLWTPAEGIDVTAKGEYGHHQLNGGQTVSGSLTTTTDFDKAGDFRYVSDNYAGSGQNENSGITTWNGAITANVALGTHTLTAIGGYSHFKTRRLSAYDERNPNGTIQPNGGNARYGNAFPEDFTQWSGEVRIASPTQQFLEYVVGAYYDSSDYHLHQDTFYTGIPLGGTIFTGHQSTDFQQDGKSYSFYGQGTVHLASALRLIGGLRYSHTDKDGAFSSRTDSGTPFNAIRANVAGSLGEHYLDPSATLQYDLARRVMVYATYARGSKSGGFVSNTYGVTAAGFQFKPERSTNYEAGIKSTLLNGRATANLSIFRTEFTNLQQSAYDPDQRTFITRNAASARSQGVEFELQLLPIPSLTLSASGAYLDAKFTDFPGAPCLADSTTCVSSNPATLPNYRGVPLQFAPKWSGNAGFEHRLNIGADYRLTSGVNAQYRSRYFIADGYSSIWGIQRGWVKVDGRLQFGPRSDAWNVAVIGRNLTDKHTVGAAIRFPASITATAREIATLDEYRSVLLQGTVRFR